jgi:hypothetical protein
MSPVNQEKAIGSKFTTAYERALEAAFPGSPVSPWILVPRDVKGCSVMISFPGGGQGRVEFTVDTIARVEAGTATYQIWPKGSVLVTTNDACEPVTALRVVAESGTARIAVRAKG